MNKYLINIASILISLIIPYIIFGPPVGLLFFGDTDLTYHFADKFFSFNNLYIWNDYFQGGSFDFNKFQGFYIKKFIFLLNSGLNNLYLFSYLWYFIPYAFFIYTFYLFIKNIVTITHKKDHIVIAIVLAVYALLNGITILYAGQILVLISLIMINLFLLFFIKNLVFIVQNRRNNIVYCLIMAMALSESTIYIQSSILLVASLGLLGLFNIKYFLIYKKIFLIQILILFVTVILLNAMWIYPLISQGLFGNSSVASIVNYDVASGLDQAKSISNQISLTQLLRLKSFDPAYNVSWNIFTIVSYIPFLLFILLLSKNRRNYFILTLSFMISVSLFLSYGFHRLTNDVYLFLWNVIPLFNTFRTVMKFSFMYLYFLIIFFAITIARINSARNFYIITISLFIVAISGLSYYSHSQFKRNITQYKIPDYYFHIADDPLIQRNITEGSAILLPQVNWQTQYKWAPPKIDGMNMLPYFLSQSSYINGAQYYMDSQYIFNDYVNHIVKYDKREEIKNIIKFRNVNRLVFQNDIRFPNDETAIQFLDSRKLDLPVVLNIFKDKSICETVNNYGQLYFCDVSNELISSPIMIKSKIVLVKHRDDVNLNHRLVKPNILSDLAYLNLTEDSVILFETENRDKKIKSNSDIFLASKSTHKNCNLNNSCIKYDFSNIPEGEYTISYVPKTYSADRLISDSIIESMETSINISGSLIENGIVIRNNKSKVLKLEGNFTISHFDKKLGGEYYLIKDNKKNFIKVGDTEIRSTKVNPTKYKLSIRNIYNGQIINFTQNYNEGWNVSSNLSHFLSDGFGNAWEIDVNKLCSDTICSFNSNGSFDVKLDINFGPQNSFSVGYFISIITALMGTLYIFYASKLNNK